MKRFKEFINESIAVLDRDYEEYFNLGYVQKLSSKMGYDATGKLEFGSQGATYTLSDNKVLKVTTDKNEFNIANKLKGKDLKRVSNVYDCVQMGTQPIYIIILEMIECVKGDQFDLIFDYAEASKRSKQSEEFKNIRGGLQGIVEELKAGGVPKPTSSDWFVNVGMKNGKLSVFDVGNKTIKYDNFPIINVSDV